MALIQQALDAEAKAEELKQRTEEIASLTHQLALSVKRAKTAEVKWQDAERERAFVRQTMEKLLEETKGVRNERSKTVRILEEQSLLKGDRGCAKESHEVSRQLVHL